MSVELLIEKETDDCYEELNITNPVLLDDLVVTLSDTIQQNSGPIIPPNTDILSLQEYYYGINISNGRDTEILINLDSQFFDRYEVLNGNDEPTILSITIPLTDGEIIEVVHSLVFFEE